MGSTVKRVGCSRNSCSGFVVSADMHKPAKAVPAPPPRSVAYVTPARLGAATGAMGGTQKQAGTAATRGGKAAAAELCRTATAIGARQ